MAPATGIKRGFYHAFSSYLASHGFGVLAFENRGIGESCNLTLDEGNPSLVSWGQLDMTAALDELIRQFPEQSYHLVGHSAGGQLFGLMQNAPQFSSVFNFACSSGSLQGIEYPFKPQAWFFLKIYIPFCNAVFGHTKSQWVGMGEPLPKQVAAEWSRWCLGTGYVKNELGNLTMEHYYETLAIPTLWIHASDDPIANSKDVEDMISVFPNLLVERRCLKPADWGYRNIGHMKFFSSKRKELWTLALDWLEQQDLSSP